MYFAEPDPDYTIGAPAQADNCMAVGASVSKIAWTDKDDGNHWWGSSYIINDIATFSSLGPRIDGKIKPDICAPGYAIISLRDTDVYTTPSSNWIDSDGVLGVGDADYYHMSGTSMACPIAAGAAALYLENHPGETPQKVYDAIKQNANRTGLNNIPNNMWGYGKLDIYAATRGYKYPIKVDGDITDSRYQTLATYTSGRNGYGDDNDLGAIKFYADGEDIYIGITGEVTSNDNIVLFFDFSGVQGRGTDILHGGNYPDWVYNVFGYLMNVKLDLDADFGLGFNEGNSEHYRFYTDAIKYDSQREQNVSGYMGETNQYGASGTFEIGSIFGGNSHMTVAYDSSFSKDSNKGVEVKIPISAFAGVDTSQTLRLFAMISSMGADVSNECIPGDPGAVNLGSSADFSSIPNQDFFTQPVKISGTPFVSTEDELSHIPETFILSQNYPNPFNANTIIEFSTPIEAPITCNIYDIKGRLIRTIVNDELVHAGNHKILWDSKDNFGNKVGSGIYIYKVKAENIGKVGKMLLLQ